MLSCVKNPVKMIELDYEKSKIRVVRETGTEQYDAEIRDLSATFGKSIKYILDGGDLYERKPGKPMMFYIPVKFIKKDNSWVILYSYT